MKARLPLRSWTALLIGWMLVAMAPSLAAARPEPTAPAGAAIASAPSAVMPVRPEPSVRPGEPTRLVADRDRSSGSDRGAGPAILGVRLAPLRGASNRVVQRPAAAPQRASRSLPLAPYAPRAPPIA